MTSLKNQAARRAEIRKFLMARRAAIAPAAVGLPGGSRRRTPGLRREELAALAGISVTWYTWLEQGRDIQISARTLERLAAALRLTPSDAEYLFSLCGTQRTETVSDSSEVVDKCVQDLLDAISETPAFVFNSRGAVLTYKRLADFVFEFDACEGQFSRNHHWRFFLDPKRRARYLDWEPIASLYVSWLRLVHGKMPDDAYFESLIWALYDGCREFRRLWDAQITAPLQDSMELRMKLPRIGPVIFNSVRSHLLHSHQVLLNLVSGGREERAGLEKTFRRAS